MKDGGKDNKQGHWRRGSKKHWSRSLAASCDEANGHAHADTTDVMHCNISSPAGSAVHRLQSQEFSESLRIKTVTNQLPFCCDQKQEAAAAKPPFKTTKEKPPEEMREVRPRAWLMPKRLTSIMELQPEAFYTEKAQSGRGKEAENRSTTELQPKSCRQ